MDVGIQSSNDLNYTMQHIQDLKVYQTCSSTARFSSLLTHVSRALITVLITNVRI